MKTVTCSALAVSMTIGLCLAWDAAPALAFGKGQIQLSQSDALPASDSVRIVKRHLVRHRARVLKRAGGESGWNATMFARLRFKPSAKLLELPANGGKLRLVVLKMHRKRWRKQMEKKVDYAAGKSVLRLPFALQRDFAAGKRHRYRVVLQIRDQRKRLQTLARGVFGLR